MPRAGSNMRAGLRALNVKDSGRVLPEPDAAIRHKCSAIILIPHKRLFMADSGPRMILPRVSTDWSVRHAVDLLIRVQSAGDACILPGERSLSG